MKIYLCTEVRKDGSYGQQIEAESMEAAAEECERMGWKLEGEIDSIIDADSCEVVYSQESAARAVSQLINGAMKSGQSHD